jgi:NDP-sugar pyrophosphorylase family protein
MRTKQALIAVGGEATRLRADGVEVPITKSFLEIEGKPLLSWCLASLCMAEVKRFVIAGNEAEHLRQADRVVGELPYEGIEACYFRDKGLGVHGLPYQARHLLDDIFFFECGHGFSESSHYEAMDEAKDDATVVFSAFEAHPDNPRQSVILMNERARLAQFGEHTGMALAHPLLIDQVYVEQLPQLNFNIVSIIDHYARNFRLSCVRSDLPPEFDVAAEFEAVQNAITAHVSAAQPNTYG